MEGVVVDRLKEDTGSLEDFFNNRKTGEIVKLLNKLGRLDDDSDLKEYIG